MEAQVEAEAGTTLESRITNFPTKSGHKAETHSAALSSACMSSLRDTAGGIRILLLLLQNLQS